ncbi:MAG: response regulator [Betaproteobacteria bacterium]|nr:response regulator [Betaproteobacteria bacterium]
MAVPSTKEMPRHILVVDDDRLVLASLAEGLRDAGYRVTGAVSGEDALRSAARDLPDLALLDVRMPGMDGIELGRRLREQANVPFLYLSAYGDEDIVKQAAEHGALGYLVKPLDVSQIVPSIEAALARARDIRALHEKESQLTTALESGRETSTAVGILMERRGLDRQQAFETLRDYARAQRRKLNEVAAEIIKAAEIINGPARPRD